MFVYYNSKSTNVRTNAFNETRPILRHRVWKVCYVFLFQIEFHWRNSSRSSRQSVSVWLNFQYLQVQKKPNKNIYIIIWIKLDKIIGEIFRVFVYISNVYQVQRYSMVYELLRINIRLCFSVDHSVHLFDVALWSVENWSLAYSVSKKKLIKQLCSNYVLYAVVYFIYKFDNIYCVRRNVVETTGDYLYRCTHIYKEEVVIKYIKIQFHFQFVHKICTQSMGGT